MRKYIRKMIKEDAKHQKVKASKYIKEIFNNLQIKKYGAYIRDLNMAKGTHKKKVWSSRVALFVKER